MRNFFSTKARQNRRRNTSRRNFLRCEQLEGRAVLSGASPVAVNDLYETMVDQPLEISAPGILANDSDAEGDAMSANLFSNPTNGTLNLAADGSFTYTPNAGFTGLDSFVYWASDGSSTSMLAAVTIRVGEFGDPPVAADDSYNVEEDGVVAIGISEGLLGNDSNPSGLEMTAAVSAGPTNGTLALAADGSFTYIPNANFFGVDSFTYVATNSAGTSNTATVNITVDPVNDAPTAENDSFEVNEDGTLTTELPSVLGNDADPDGDTLTPIMESGPVNGTVVLNSDGTFTYTPNANFNGVDGFSYLVNDGTVDSDVATVTISVASVNDLPVAVNDEYDVDEDTPLNVDAAAGVLVNDSDLEGETLTSVIVSQPLHGLVTLNADGSFQYTPEANYAGVDGFSYLASDGLGQSTVATVTLHVNPVNDNPTPADDAFTVAEDGVLEVAAAGVLGNDTDIDLDTLTAAIGTGPAHGTVTLNADGSFSYTPEANYNGTDSFTYTASDAAGGSAVATVNITVTPENDNPTAADDAYTVAEDGVLEVAAAGVLGNDTDIDLDTLTATIGATPAHGTVTLNADGSFNYTPEANYSGADSFTYTATDSAGGSATATVNITVTAVNDGPVAAADAFATTEDTVFTSEAGALLANDSDADGDSLTAALVSGPAHGSVVVNADGSFQYTPAADYNGEDTFTYSTSDGTLTSEATVTMTVSAANDAPTAGADSYSVDEDQVLTVDAATGLLLNDLDVDGDTLTAAVASGPANGSVTVNADGSFEYTPNANFNGSDSFTYTVSDGTLSATGTVNITVNAVADAPVVGGDAYSIGEDLTLTVDAALGVLANDVAPTGVALTASVVTPPEHGTLTLNADGSFSFVPEANWHGTTSFTYKAVGEDSEEMTGTATIIVEPLNDRPVAADDSFDVAGDLSSTVLTNDTDVEGNPLTATLIEGPSSGELTLNSDGSFNYSPAEGFEGDVTFRYQLNDGMANSNVATVTLHVTDGPLSSPPVSTGDSYTMDADTTLTVDALGGVLTNDAGSIGSSLTAVLVTPPGSGELTLNADGSFSYTPESGFSGQVQFTYKAMDGTLEGLPATVTIDVIPGETNSAPVAVDDAYEASADTTLTIGGTGILANDSDADGDALEAAIVAGPTNGLVTLNADGSFTYVPVAGFTGTDTFTYQATDGADVSNLATVVINVASLENTRPVAANDEYTVPAGATTDIPAAGVLANDTDAQGDALAANLFSGPLHGTLTLNADGSFSYTPDEGYTGLDSFIYWTFDGELNSALAAVTLHVEGAAESPEPNDPPAEGESPIDPPAEGEDPSDCLIADESFDPWTIDSILEDEDWFA